MTSTTILPSHHHHWAKPSKNISLRCRPPCTADSTHPRHKNSITEPRSTPAHGTFLYDTRSSRAARPSASRPASIRVKSEKVARNRPSRRESSTMTKPAGRSTVRRSGTTYANACGELHKHRRSVGPHRQTKTPKAQSVRSFIIRITEAPTTDNAHPATRQFRSQVHARQSTSRGEVSANRSSRERTDRRVGSKSKPAGAHRHIFALE